MKKKNKKKVWFVSSDGFHLTWLRADLGIYTLNNGEYPDEIHMTRAGVEHYKDLMLVRPISDTVSFCGISIKVNEVEDEKATR